MSLEFVHHRNGCIVIWLLLATTLSSLALRRDDEDGSAELDELMRVGDLDAEELHEHDSLDSLVSAFPCGCDIAVSAPPSQTWETAKVAEDFRRGVQEEAKLKLEAVQCQMVQLLSVGNSEKKRGFASGSSYCVASADKHMLTLENLEGNEIRVPKAMWMKRWMLEGENQTDVDHHDDDSDRDDSSGCVANMDFSCVKNIEKEDGRSESAMYVGNDQLSTLLPSDCRHFGNQKWKITLQQVNGQNGCGEFNVYDSKGKLVKPLSWKSSSSEFGGSGCAATDWAARPQACMTSAFFDWLGPADATTTEFIRRRNALCGSNSDLFVPCWLGNSTSTT